MVQVKSGDGAVRVLGDNHGENLETGPRLKPQYYIIKLEGSQTLSILGSPTVRYILATES